MQISRVLVSFAAAAAFTLTACGGDDSTGSDAADTPSSEPSGAGDSGGSDSDSSGADPDDTPSPTSPEPGAPSSSEAGSSTDVVDICSAISEDEMSEVLGGPVTTHRVPGGGCTFTNSDDTRAPSAALNQTTVDDFVGGFEGARAGVASVIKGKVEDLSGIGDDAFVVTGPALGGTATTGSGAVLLDEQVVQVTVLQGKELGADKVTQLTTDVLTLVGSKG